MARSRTVRKPPPELAPDQQLLAQANTSLVIWLTETWLSDPSILNAIAEEFNDSSIASTWLVSDEDGSQWPLSREVFEAFARLTGALDRDQVLGRLQTLGSTPGDWLSSIPLPATPTQAAQEVFAQARALGQAWSQDGDQAEAGAQSEAQMRLAAQQVADRTKAIDQQLGVQRSGPQDVMINGQRFRLPWLPINQASDPEALLRYTQTMQPDPLLGWPKAVDGRSGTISFRQFTQEYGPTTPPTDVVLDEDTLVRYRLLSRGPTDVKDVAELLDAIPKLVEHIEWLEDMLLHLIKIYPCHIASHDEQHANGQICGMQFTPSLTRALRDLGIRELDTDQLHLLSRYPHEDCEACRRDPRVRPWLETGYARVPTETD